MSIKLNISPQVEARLTAAARQNGIDLITQFERIVTDFLPPLVQEVKTLPTADAENAAVIALMDEWMTQAPVDAEGIRQAKAEVDELMLNLGKNRNESGESPLFS